MSGLEGIRKATEEVCDDENIPEELKAVYDELWEEIHRAIIKAEQRIYGWDNA